MANRGRRREAAATALSFGKEYSRQAEVQDQMALHINSTKHLKKKKNYFLTAFQKIEEEEMLTN